MKRVWQRFGFRLIGLALVAYVALTTDWPVVSAAFSGLSPLNTILVTLLGLPAIGLKAQRWRSILGLQSIVYPLRRALPVYLYTTAMGFLSPGRLGEFLKVPFLCREAGVSYFQGTVSVVADRLFDLLILLLVTLFGLLFYVRGASLGEALVQTLLGFTACTLMAILFLRPRTGVKRDGGTVPGTNSTSFNGISAGSIGVAILKLRPLLNPAAILKLLLFTVAATMVHFWQNTLFAGQLGLDLNILQIGFALAVVNIASWLPVSVMGIGTREVTLIYVLGFYGVDQSHAISFSLLIFAVLVVSNLFITAVGSLVLSQKGKTV